MVVRTPNDKCFICLENDATKKNSHLIPAAFLNLSLGKRNNEASFEISTNPNKIDAFYGRANLKNRSTKIKQFHWARDYYFCPECEKRLGKLESDISPHITTKLRDSRFKQNYDWIEAGKKGELPIVVLKKANADAFNTLMLSIIWRVAILYTLEKGIRPLTPIDLMVIRRIIHSYLYEIEQDYQLLCDQYGLIIITAENFLEPTRNIGMTDDYFKRPIIFYIFEFLIFAYSAQDFENARQIGSKKYFKLPPQTDLLNFCNLPPKLAIVGAKFWDEINQKLLSQIKVLFKVKKPKKWVTRLKDNRGRPIRKRK